MLYCGNMMDLLDELEAESVESIITDPPYELNFMGESWDNSGISFQPETWKKCFEVLKPGGYLLAFGGSRTHHRIMCAIEAAGFEVRDCIMWIYGSGFPKGVNVGLAIDKRNGIEVKSDYIPNNKSNVYSKTFCGGKAKAGDKPQEAQNKWNGWRTCLKPAYEPIAVARKPFSETLVDNVIKNETGGLNIDECRIGDTGRFPANVIHGGVNEKWSEYFYCAKTSKKDRDEGLDEFEEKTSGERTNRKDGTAGITGRSGASGSAKNFHPTVKPHCRKLALVFFCSTGTGIKTEKPSGAKTRLHWK